MIVGGCATLLDVVLDSDSPTVGGPELHHNLVVCLQRICAGVTVVVASAADGNCGSISPVQRRDRRFARLVEAFRNKGAVCNDDLGVSIKGFVPRGAGQGGVWHVVEGSEGLVNAWRYN
jgi:hypothetical protein